MITLNEFPDYVIYPNGDVYGKLSNKILKPKTNEFGYKALSLKNIEGVYKTKKVHRLVVEAYIGNIPHKYEVNHIDGDKANNNVENLEIVTSKENKAHAWRTELYTHKGEGHYAASVSEATIHSICKDMQDGLRNIDIARKFDLHKDYIANIRCGRTWKHISEEYVIAVKRNKRKSRETIVGVCIMIRSGETDKTISQAYNIDPRDVNKIRNKQTHKTISDNYF